MARELFYCGACEKYWSATANLWTAWVSNCPRCGRVRETFHKQGKRQSRLISEDEQLRNDPGNQGG